MAEQRGPFTHILVPTDGSEPSISAGMLAIRIASTHQVPIIFVYVIDTMLVEKMASATGRSTEMIDAELRAKGQSYLDYLTHMAANRGLETEQVILRGLPHAEIANLARERGVDLIVIGHSSSRGPARVDIGSVTRRVIESAPCPVLVTRQPYRP